ncbi:MAG: IS4 family transposase [Bacteroidetes bacterium]|nr:IS4 family transposase [Bacteroidota bacterium]
MLSEIFQPFVKESPISVMVGGLLARVFSPDEIDHLFEVNAQRQYTKELLFSTLFDLMSKVVCGIRPSIHAAYQATSEEIAVSITSVYNKLNATETGISAALVRYSAAQLAPVIEHLGGSLEPLLPGYRVKILDGNCIEASEHRIEELRYTNAGALPGKSLVVYDPSLKLALDVFPCEDGHAQERALLDPVLSSVEPGDLWIADRNFCIRKMLLGIADRGGYFLIREHKKLAWQAMSPLAEVGETDTGVVYEQVISIEDDNGQRLPLRRIVLVLDRPTRDGETQIVLLTNVPSESASACELADLYRSRWLIEGAFQELAEHLSSEINTLGYPRAALFGFCVALIASNVLSVVKAALRSVHGLEKIEEEVSGYYIADEIAGTYRGMMIAIPVVHWTIFSVLTEVELVAVLQELAGRVRLSAFKKHRRGPKKKPPRRSSNKREPHVSTARLIAHRRARNKTP